MTTKITAMAGAMLWIAYCNIATAHFLWLVPLDESGARVLLYFSEGPEPDDPALLKRVATVQATPFRNKNPDPRVSFEWNGDQTKLIAYSKGERWAG